MARMLYGAGGDGVLLEPEAGTNRALFAPNKTGGIVSTDLAGANVIDDLLAPDGLTPVTTASSDARARVLVWGPDEMRRPLYVDFGDGPIAIYPVEAFASVGDLSTLTEQVAEATALAGQALPASTVVAKGDLLIGTGPGEVAILSHPGTTDKTLVSTDDDEYVWADRGGSALDGRLVDATAGYTIPSGTPDDRIVLRLAAPAPRVGWVSAAVQGETSSGASSLGVTIHTGARAGQVAVLVAVAANGTATFTPPADAVTLLASQSAGGTSLAVYAVVLGDDPAGDVLTVGLTMTTPSRARVLAIGVDGVTADGAAVSSVVASASATSTPTVPGVAATGPGAVLRIVAQRPSVAVVDGGHIAWPTGLTEVFDDAVARTTTDGTVLAAVAAQLLAGAVTLDPVQVTSDYAAPPTSVALWLPAIDPAVMEPGAPAWLAEYGGPVLVEQRLEGDIVWGTSTVTSAVRWPDGTTGTFTGTLGPAGAIDAYLITYGAGPTAPRVQQPTLTRNAAGQVIKRPALVVTA